MAGQQRTLPVGPAESADAGPESPGEGDLVRRAAAGDHQAFGELMDRHRRAVYRTAYAALGSAADAEDVAQDTFIAAFRKLPSFRAESTFRTWLMAIAWRNALSRRRSLLRWLRRTAGRGHEGDEGAAPVDGLRSNEPSQEDAATADELRATLKRLIASLPPKMRDPLLLAGSGEYSIEEIGRILRVPAGTVKWRIFEARRRLKVKLAALGYDDHD